MMQPQATWANCRADFTFDGSLIDLLSPGTGPREWEQFYVALRSGPFEVRGYRDGELWLLPETAAEVFAVREVATVTVSVLSSTVTANCHFFGGELELNIDPREVVSEAAFESLLVLMRFVAAAVRLPVFAAAEGSRAEHAFLRVSPDGQAVFLPSGSIQQPSS